MARKQRMPGLSHIAAARGIVALATMHCLAWMIVFFGSDAMGADQLLARRVLDVAAWCGNGGAILHVVPGKAAKAADVVWQDLFSTHQQILAPGGYAPPDRVGFAVSSANCSSNGRFVAFENASTLMLADTSTGRLARLGPHSGGAEIVWAPDSKSFLFYANAYTDDYANDRLAIEGRMRSYEGVAAIDASRILHAADANLAALLETGWWIVDAAWVNTTSVLIKISKSNGLDMVFLFTNVVTNPKVRVLDLGYLDVEVAWLPKVPNDALSALVKKAHCKFEQGFLIGLHPIRCYDASGLEHRSGMDGPDWNRHDFDVKAYCASPHDDTESPLCTSKSSNPAQLYRRGKTSVVLEDSWSEPTLAGMQQVGDLYRISDPPRR